MTILLANTWTPACAGSGLLQSDAVPHYLAAFIAALLAARPDDDGRGKPRVRFLLRRADDMHALQAAVAPLLQSGAWEAAIVPAADDVPALERALHGARVVLWADDGRGHQLMRDGRVLLHLAAHMGVQRFVFRSQVQPNTGSKAADEGIALLEEYRNRHALAFTVIQSAPLFLQPVHKLQRADTVTYTLACAASVTSHPSLAELAAAEAALVVRCAAAEKPHPPVYDRYELVSRLYADAGVGNNYFQQSRAPGKAQVRATGGGRRAAPRATYHAHEAGETMERLHEAWLSYYPTREAKRSSVSLPKLKLFSVFSRQRAPSLPPAGTLGIAVTQTRIVATETAVVPAEATACVADPALAHGLPRHSSQETFHSAFTVGSGLTFGSTATDVSELPPVPTSPTTPRRVESLPISFLNSGPWKLELPSHGEQNLEIET